MTIYCGKGVEVVLQHNQTLTSPTNPTLPILTTTPSNSNQLDEFGVAQNVIDGYVSGATVFID